MTRTMTEDERTNTLRRVAAALNLLLNGTGTPDTGFVVTIFPLKRMTDHTQPLDIVSNITTDAEMVEILKRCIARVEQHFEEEKIGEVKGHA